MKLNVGTVVYQTGVFMRKFEISRVSKTLAFVDCFGAKGYLKFKREVRDDHDFTSIKDMSLVPVRYAVASPEVEEQFEKFNLLGKIRSLDFLVFDVGFLRHIIESHKIAKEAKEAKDEDRKVKMREKFKQIHMLGDEN